MASRNAFLCRMEGGVAVYFYKTMENGEVSMIESRSIQAVNLPENMVEISEEEYGALLAEIEERIKREQEEMANKEE